MSIASKLTRTLAGILAGGFLFASAAQAACPSNNCHTPNKGKRPDVLLEPGATKRDWRCLKFPSGIDSAGRPIYQTHCYYY